MDEITVSFKIRLPSAKKIQIQEVVEEQEEVEEQELEETSTFSMPIPQSERWQPASENVSLSRSPELANFFAEEENDVHVTDEVEDSQSVPAAAGIEDTDTDSESEYEYEEVTVTDDSECEEEEDEGEEFAYDSRGCERQAKNKRCDCEDRDSSGLGFDESDDVDVAESDNEEEQLVNITEETVTDVSEDGCERREEQATKHETLRHSCQETSFTCQQETLDPNPQKNRLDDILEEEGEDDDYDEERVREKDEMEDDEASDDGSSSDEFDLLEQAGTDDGRADCEIGTGDDSSDVFQDRHVPDGSGAEIEHEGEGDETKGETGTEMLETGEEGTGECLPNGANESDDSRVVMFDHEIVRFVIRKSRKAVKITEIIDELESVEKRDAEEMEEMETLASPDIQTPQDPQTSEVPVFTFKLRRSRTENAFEESGYDAEDEDEACSTDDGSSCSGNNEHAFAASGESVEEEDNDEEDDPNAFETRKRMKRADSFTGNESILAKVLVLLPFTDRVKCESVSKTWNSAIKEVNSSHQSSLGVIGIRSRDERLQNFCPLPSHRVDQADCVLITSSFDITSVLKKVPNLLSLHLRCDGSANVFHDVETSSQVGLLCPRLEHISVVDDISGPDIYDHVIPLISQLSELRHIQLRFPCKSSHMVRENVMIRKCLDRYREKMEILSVNVPLHEDTCAYIANFCRLRKLSLHGTTIPMSGLVYLLERGNIRGKYIKCFNIVIDSKDQLQIITKNMVCLHSFHCVFSQFATKSLQPKDVQSIGRLKNLRTLFLSIWTNQLIDEGLIGIALGCRQLSSLTVNAEVSDQSVKYLGSFCPLLQRLELNTTIPELITDASIDSLIQLKQLRYLTLYYCDISDEGVHRLLSGTKDLELLSISFSHKITCKTINIMSKFAEEKPWERVTLVLPKSLNQSVHWISHDIPRNLDVCFNV